jgi:hypothetical protein
MKQETRKKLRLFVKKVEQLSSFGFMPSYFQGGGIRFTGLDSPDERMGGASREAIHAFAVGLRFFIHDPDGISFRILADTVASAPGLSDEWKQEFRQTRRKLNKYLDSPMTSMGLGYKPGGKKQVSRRDVLETFLYGDIIHFGERHGELDSYEEWESSNEFALFECALEDILAYVYGCVFHIAQLTKQELDDDDNQDNGD